MGDRGPSFTDTHVVIWVRPGPWAVYFAFSILFLRKIFKASTRIFTTWRDRGLRDPVFWYALPRVLAARDMV